MAKRDIICVDDQREVLAALSKDLEVIGQDFEITNCETADEADELINQYVNEGRDIALLICDHIMPGENGVDFLARIHKDSRFSNVKKILLTGLATHEDTIRAINEARIDAYLEKPWDPDELVSTVKKVLK